MSFDLILGDVNAELCHEWRHRFRPHKVEIHNGDFFDIAADAYVSPANSHGIMDGGFDLLLRLRFPGVDVSVQREIDERGGLLRVGHALIVETGDWDVPYLVCAPTMEVPSVIAGTRNVFLAMRATLESIHTFNRENDGAIQSVAVPGLGTGVGKVPPSSAAAQMLEAYEHFLGEH
ncbi:MAG: macro domain-containing protein [Armatimonadetes bacterium]|nr:macro domain-containing protein [Armatimonadota bacterium]